MTARQQQPRKNVDKVRSATSCVRDVDLPKNKFTGKIKYHAVKKLCSFEVMEGLRLLV